MVVSDFGDVDENVLHSDTKIYLSKDVLSLGFRLLGMIRILRADPKNSFRWVGYGQ